MKTNRRKTVLINGDFFCRRLTGIERFAIEMTAQLDALSGKNEIALIVPRNAPLLPAYANITVIRHHSKIRSHFIWKMIALQWFLITHRQYIVLEFGNTCLPFAPGIVFLHDIYYEFFKEDFVSRRDKFTRLYSRMQYRLIAWLAKKIVTVSEYSRDEISKTFGIDKSKIAVIYNSAEHMKNICADNSVFAQFSILTDKSYYFSLGSLSRRKNMRWIIRYATEHPDSIFAVSGAEMSTMKIAELKDSLRRNNIIMLGYLDDGKVKALMERCKAFIQPSYYEGFGIPPLEALACGAKIVVANAASLPEIYGNTAHYIDPFDTNIDLDELLKEPVEPPEQLFVKYSYYTSARRLYDIIKNYKEDC